MLLWREKDTDVTSKLKTSNTTFLHVAKTKYIKYVKPSLNHVHALAGTHCRKSKLLISLCSMDLNNL